jgi:hypothetical protein
MSRTPRTFETFDIVLNLKDGDTFHEHDLVRPPAGIHPGCQDVPIEEVNFLRSSIFDKIADAHGYDIEVVRKVHAWCVNCNGYIGYIKLPFEVIPFNIKEKYNCVGPETQVKLQSRTLRCSGCYHHTTISIRDLMSCY